MEETVYIGLGSNLGDGCRNLQTAWQGLGRQPEITLLALSSPYRTSPMGMQSSFWFTNAVGKMATGLEPVELLERLLQIEREMGRRRHLGQDREIDLDLLLYGAKVLKSAGLSVPHPEMHKRLFVLEPLCELAPDLAHPVLGRTVRELRDALLCDRSQSIQKISWP